MAPYFRSNELVDAIVNKVSPHLTGEALAEVRGLLGELVEEAGRHNAPIDRKAMEERFFAQAREIQKIKDANAEKSSQ